MKYINSVNKCELDRLLSYQKLFKKFFKKYVKINLKNIERKLKKIVHQGSQKLNVDTILPKTIKDMTLEVDLRESIEKELKEYLSARGFYVRKKSVFDISISWGSEAEHQKEIDEMLMQDENDVNEEE